MITVLLAIIFLLVLYGVVVTWAAIDNRNTMEYWLSEYRRMADSYEKLYKWVDAYMDADIERRVDKEKIKNFRTK